MKTCITCHETKPLDAFGSYKRYADGKHRICRICWNAYANTRRYANGTVPYLPFLERLWQSIQQCHHEPACPFCCWPWLKACDKDGYGKISINNAAKEQFQYRVTRIVYELWHAVRIPDDQLVCHHCDSPPCANPSHLWLGSHNDNRQDCVKKGRTARGLRNGIHTHPEAFPHLRQDFLHKTRRRS